MSVPGAISGTGELFKIGGGTLTLSGSNSYTGGTGLNAGQLNINSPAALGIGPSRSPPTRPSTIPAATP